jgi:hypothetical protein
MRADSADLCIDVYVLTDEAYREVAAPDGTRPGPRAAFTDSALITLTLAAVTKRIRGAIMARRWRVLEAEGRALAVLDSVPVPVVGYHHAAGDHRWWGEGDCGRVPAKKPHRYGFKLRLLIARSGPILDFALAPAHHSDGALTEPLRIAKRWSSVRGDKA